MCLDKSMKVSRITRRDPLMFLLRNAKICRICYCVFVAIPSRVLSTINHWRFSQFGFTVRTVVQRSLLSKKVFPAIYTKIDRSSSSMRPTFVGLRTGFRTVIHGVQIPQKWQSFTLRFAWRLNRCLNAKALTKTDTSRSVSTFALRPARDGPTEWRVHSTRDPSLARLCWQY